MCSGVGVRSVQGAPWIQGREAEHIHVRASTVLPGFAWLAHILKRVREGWGSAGAQISDIERAAPSDAELAREGGRVR